MKRLSFTQPVCDDCWDAEHPENPARRLDAGEAECCCQCGALTRSGIYIRVDPLTVPYASHLKDA